MQGLLPGGWELGITISLPTDVDILRITEVYREARDHELLVAFDEFQGNGGQVMHLESLLPDYLVLAANMTKDLTSTRQPLRRLESLLAACEELAIKPVLPRNDIGPRGRALPGNRLRPGAAVGDARKRRRTVAELSDSV